MTLPHTGHSILVVDADPLTLSMTVECLRGAGHRAATAATFEEAKQLLVTNSPDILITDIRLGAFNGLHLVLRRQFYQPESASIVTSAHVDRMLESEARAMNVPYLLKPLERVELLTLVDMMLGKAPPVSGAMLRRWPRRRITGGFGATVDDASAVVLNVSDGGLCLELHEPFGEVLPSSFRVTIPAVGLSVPADSVWTRMDTESNVLKCGAAIAPTDREAVQAWQYFVDTLG